jgi:hypothetical protein
MTQPLIRHEPFGSGIPAGLTPSPGRPRDTKLIAQLSRSPRYKWYALFAQGFLLAWV